MPKLKSSLLAATAMLSAASAIALPTAGGASAANRADTRFDGGFTIASFNTLGASHTGPRGKHPQMASGQVRTVRAIKLLRRHAVDVVGLQEFQRPQARTFQRRAGDTFRVFSPAGDTENSVAWRKDRFRLVGARTVAIPYFNGHHRRMPVVRLAVRSSGQQLFVANFHNPADTRRFPHQARWRARATQLEIALVHRLGRTGLPVLVTGDMNERRSYVRKVAGATPLKPALGPRYSGIDWILGNHRTRFAAPKVDRSPAVRRTTDHPVVLARVDYAG